MKRLLLYLTIPALVATSAFVAALHFEPFGFGMFAVYGVLGFFYYAAPYLLWAFIAAFSKASGAICHAGFIAATIALVTIVSVSFTGAHEPSGLPLQWVAYWPSALVLQALLIAVTAAARSK